MRVVQLLQSRKLFTPSFWHTQDEHAEYSGRVYVGRASRLTTADIIGEVRAVSIE